MEDNKNNNETTNQLNTELKTTETPSEAQINGIRDNNLQTENTKMTNQQESISFTKSPEMDQTNQRLGGIVFNEPIGKSRKKMFIIPVVIITFILAGGIAFAAISILDDKSKDTETISQKEEKKPDKIKDNKEKQINITKPETVPTETTPPISPKSEKPATNIVPQQVVAINPPVTPAPVAPMTEYSTLGAKETWLKIRPELDNITTFEEIISYTSKHGSKENIAKIAETKAQVDGMGQEAKDFFVTIFKNPSSSDITTVEEIVIGNTATLNVKTKNSGETAVVNMVKEDGRWKIQLESWKTVN